MKIRLKFLSLFLLIAALFSAMVFFILPLPGTIPVLMYHFVGSKEDAAREGNYVSRESFAEQMAFLSFFKYRVLTMDEYCKIRMGERKSHGREVLVTFDDGNPSFASEAFPILQKYSIPATAFVISDSVKNESAESMSKAELENLHESGLVTIASHTKTHPALSGLTMAQIRDELLGSKRDLEQIFQVPVLYLAYPFGNFDSRVMKVAQESGYRLAFTTGHKQLKGNNEGNFCLTRVKINRVSDPPLVFWYHLSGIHQYIKQAREKLKTLESN